MKSVLYSALMSLFIILAGSYAAGAIETIQINRDDKALDLTATTEIYSQRGDAFQVSTAADSDGIVRRIEVRASADNHSGDWAVFSLANTTDSQIDRLIVAPHFRMVGSGLIWPDLGSQRIISITPSEGFALEREESQEADVFRITINPGSVITFVAELAAPSLPQIYLWEPEAYKDTVNSFTLYRGIVLGIAGLLAVFLTIIFVVKGTTMLPATAALAWAVLAYICVDFGFGAKLISASPGDERIWRAATEVLMAAGLVIFLFSYLRLNRWNTHLSYAMLSWVGGLALMFAVAIFDPPIAAGIARISFGLTALAGVGLIGYLGLRRYDRAIMLIPTWILVLAWIFAAWMTISGQLANDIVQPALGGGLVLVVLLMGFTVMQHAFAGGAYQQGLFSDLERQSLAINGSGDVVWDWDVARDRITTSPDIAGQLGLSPGTLHGPARSWLSHLHPDERDRFRTVLDVILEHRKGRLRHEFRIRAEDGHFHWLSLRARPVLGSDGEVIRCVGTLIDTTEQKNAEERLLHGAVHDNLTGLPNRELFLDRLDTIVSMARIHADARPTVIMIDIDGFKKVNDSIGMAGGDTLLLALSRRLTRLLKPQDTLARMGGDRFAMIVVSEQDATRMAGLARAVKTAIASPIYFAQRELILTPSIGMTTWVDQNSSASDLVQDAELALDQAKRFGGNRIEPFRPAFKAVGSSRVQLESDLRRAIERGELTVLYQPIMRLKDNEIAGFEALLGWDHPRRGTIDPSEFLPVAEESDLIIPLVMHAIKEAIQALSEVHKAPGHSRLFMSTNLLSAQMLTDDLQGDIQSTLTQFDCDPANLRLEISERIITSKPEQAAIVLPRIGDLGVSLILGDFGTGHSSIGQLTRFPFGMLRIDRSITDPAGKNDAIMRRSIISMARDLGMEVIAQGVVDTNNAMELAQLGCDFGQSRLFGPPASREAMLRLLNLQVPIAKAS